MFKYILFKYRPNIRSNIGQILGQKLGQIYTVPRYIKKEIERIYDFLWKGKNETSQAPSSTLQLGGWTRFFYVDTSLNSLKIKCIQRLLNSAFAFWIDLMVYWLNLILKSNQGLALVRQKQILRSNRYEILGIQNNEDFSIQLLNAWLHFTNNNFPIAPSIEEILDHPIFLNPHTKLEFSSDKAYFYCIPPRNISDKFTIIKDLCRFLQPGLISSTTFDEEQGFLTTNYERIYKLIKDLILNDWKHLLRTETSQKIPFKNFLLQ